MANQSRYKEQKDHISGNTAIIDWVLAIYGSYIGIWLGLFIQQMWQNKNNVVVLLTDENHNSFISIFIIIGFPILFFVFTYYMIRWVWILKDLSPQQTTNEVLKRLRKSGGFPFYLFTIVGLLFIGWFFQIDCIWVFTGIFAFIGWFALILVLVLSDRREWKQ